MLYVVSEELDTADFTVFFFSVLQYIPRQSPFLVCVLVSKDLES